MDWSRIYIVVAASIGALDVLLGAFGAHKLKSFLIEMNRLDTFETAVKYQMYHALALLFVGILIPAAPSKLMIWSGTSFLIGIVLFSGSLYLLCFTSWRWLGPITPIGGLFLIGGWILLATAFFNK